MYSVSLPVNLSFCATHYLNCPFALTLSFYHVIYLRLSSSPLNYPSVLYISPMSSLIHSQSLCLSLRFSCFISHSTCHALRWETSEQGAMKDKYIPRASRPITLCIAPALLQCSPTPLLPKHTSPSTDFTQQCRPPRPPFFSF